jgi:hypothetical protein
VETNIDSTLGLVSEADYAAFVGKTIASVRNERSAGLGPPFVKKGNMIKYPLAGIRKFVEQHTIEPGRAATLVTRSANRDRRRGAVTR